MLKALLLDGTKEIFHVEVGALTLALSVATDDGTVTVTSTSGVEAHGVAEIRDKHRVNVMFDQVGGDRGDERVWKEYIGTSSVVTW